MENVTAEENAPTPEQLFHLASRAVVLAKQNRQYRVNRRAQNPRSHFVMPSSEVIVPDLLEGPFGYRYEHKLSGRVSKEIDEKTHLPNWSLHIRVGYDVTEMGDERGAERHTYSFKWDAAGVKLARHILRVAPSVDKDISDYILTFENNIMPSEWHWRMQLEELTSGDVDLLLQDVEAFDWSQKTAPALSDTSAAA